MTNEVIYIASRVSRRQECYDLALKLIEQGHTINARWVIRDEDHVMPEGLSAQAEDAERRRFAIEDVEDMNAASWCISLMDEPRGNSRGGRHVEFGYCLARNLRMTIIGPRENVFHHLPHVEHFDGLSGFLAAQETDHEALEPCPMVDQKEGLNMANEVTPTQADRELWKELIRLPSANLARRRESQPIVEGLELIAAHHIAHEASLLARNAELEGQVRKFDNAASLFSQLRTTIMVRFDGLKDGDRSFWLSIHGAFDKLASAHAALKQEETK